MSCKIAKGEVFLRCLNQRAPTPLIRCEEGVPDSATLTSCSRACPWPEQPWAAVIANTHEADRGMDENPRDRSGSRICLWSNPVWQAPFHAVALPSVIPHVIPTATAPWGTRWESRSCCGMGTYAASRTCTRENLGDLLQ